MYGVGVGNAEGYVGEGLMIRRLEQSPEEGSRE